MIKRILPSDLQNVSGCDITTAYTIFPSTGALSQRVNSFLSLISRAICSVLIPCPEDASTNTMASSIFIFITLVGRFRFRLIIRIQFSSRRIYSRRKILVPSRIIINFTHNSSLKERFLSDRNQDNSSMVFLPIPFRLFNSEMEYEARSSTVLIPFALKIAIVLLERPNKPRAD